MRIESRVRADLLTVVLFAVFQCLSAIGAAIVMLAMH